MSSLSASMPGDTDIEAPISQKNMDYSIFKALNFNMDGIEAALICYDVMCQWSVHMKDRVAGSRLIQRRIKKGISS